MNSKKKYKLFSAAAVEGPRPCAFFASAEGCRNGDECPFAHINPKVSVPSYNCIKREVVSSESSDDDNSMNHDKSGHSKSQTTPFQLKQPSQVQGDGNKNETLVKQDIPNLMEGENSSSKKAKRRKRKASVEGERNTTSPFPDPPPGKKAKTPLLSPSVTKKVSSLPYSDMTTTWSAKNLTTSKLPSHLYSEMGNLQANGSSSETPKSHANSLSSKNTSFRSLDLPTSLFPVAANAREETKQTNSNFRHLNLPVASVSKASGNDPKEQMASRSDESTFIVPKSNFIGRQWAGVVKITQQHPRFAYNYNFSRIMKIDQVNGSSSTEWIKFKRYGDWCSENPQVIAIDCEMCETTDPLSANKESKALCRLSVVDAITDEVLLDTLVKPNWPVTDYRTSITGIAAEHLENVQFTVRHAQAFMMALCSEETIVVGHSVHNDFAAMKIQHTCVVDTACLFKSADSERSTVSLKDLAYHLFKVNMPEVHDSVNDARVALECVKDFVEKNGKVEAIPRSISAKEVYSTQLLVHRINRNSCNESHLKKMFLSYTDIQPTEIEPIEYNDKNIGKTMVVFRTARHANLAFDTLDGKADIDPSGRQQKKIYLRNGDHIKVRKMAFDQPRNKGEDTSRENINHAVITSS